MYRKKSYKTKSRMAAARRRQETQEQRAERLEKIRVRAATRRASETAEAREIRLAKARARVSATRKNLKDKARRFNKESHVENLSRMSEPSSVGLNRKEYNNYRAYLQYNQQLKAAAESEKARRSRETFEKRSLRLEKDRLYKAAARASESEEQRAGRLLDQRMRVRKAHLQKKLHQQRVEEVSAHGTVEAVEKDKPTHSTPLTQWESRINVINGFCSRFRGGMCPKSAGNYDLMMDEVSIECDVVLKEESEPLDMSVEPLFQPPLGQSLLVDKEHFKETSDVDLSDNEEDTSYSRKIVNVKKSGKKKRFFSSSKSVLENLGLVQTSSNASEKCGAEGTSSNETETSKMDNNS